MADIDDRERTGNRRGQRANDEVGAQSEALAIDVETGCCRVDLRIVHLVALVERVGVAKRFDAGLLQSLDDEGRGFVEPGRRRVASEQLVGREVVEVSFQLVGCDPIGSGADVARQHRRLRVTENSRERDQAKNV